MTQKRCAFCDSQTLHLIADLGNVALAGAFLTKERFDQEKTFPLRLFFCSNCYAVQLVDLVPAEIMFREYFYFSSSIGTLRNHFRAYASKIVARFLNVKTASVLEFGCNDGVLLRPLADLGIKTVIGVDPATNVVATISDSRVTVINEYFTEEVAREIVAEYGHIDVIMANNVYAHIPDIQAATRAVATALHPEGVFVFEVHYLGKLLEELQYDMIYHEHLYYYSLLALKNHLARYDMMVFDLEHISIHAGSIRFYVCRKGSKRSSSISDAVVALEAKERDMMYDKLETYTKFSAAMADHKQKLVSLLNSLRSQGKRIAGYGASGRANTMIQYCELTDAHLAFMIDDAPAKAGMFTPKSHFEIFPSAVLDDPGRPDYLLVFAWSFLNEIKERNERYLASGGQFIVPLPDVSILSSNRVYDERSVTGSNVGTKP